MKHEVRYGDGSRCFKVIKNLGFEDALRIYNTAKRFAEKHNLTWTVSLWETDGWLVQSETINPTAIIS